MCIARNKAPNPLAQIDSQRVTAQATTEARLRRRRAGIGSDILTGPLGIPANGATTKLGQAA